MKNELLVEMLTNLKYKISFAESCTGGLLASKIVDVHNASTVFDLGLVTYANEMKAKFLNVNLSTINKFNVVSEEVAYEMIVGLKNISNADCGISITGLAGPQDYLNIKAGTVCFGFFIKEEIIVKTAYFLNKERNEVRELATEFAINEMLNLLTLKNK